MPASMQAKVFPGDANPLEVLGGDEHLLHQFAVLVLEPLSLHKGLSRFGNTIGEAVSNGLQLAEVKHLRCGGSGLNPVRNLRVTEPLGDEAGELFLKPSDLPAQLQTRLALIDRDIQPVESPLSQQSRHLQRL
jgi:hypothetical protein